MENGVWCYELVASARHEGSGSVVQQNSPVLNHSHWPGQVRFWS